MDTDSSNEDSRGSSTETVSANLEGHLCQESGSIHSSSEETEEGIEQKNWKLYLKVAKTYQIF
jgi:hypothetical protein